MLSNKKLLDNAIKKCVYGKSKDKSFDCWLKLLNSDPLFKLKTIYMTNEDLNSILLHYKSDTFDFIGSYSIHKLPLIKNIERKIYTLFILDSEKYERKGHWGCLIIDNINGKIIYYSPQVSHILKKILYFIKNIIGVMNSKKISIHFEKFNFESNQNCGIYVINFIHNYWLNSDNFSI